MKHLPLMIINSVPHRLQRYDTTGDWFDRSGVMHFVVSQMDIDKEMETLLHELFEWHLCQKEGITAKTVDDWDFAHPELEEPGRHPDCPYRVQHAKAITMSKLAVKLMGYDWKDYDTEYMKLVDELSKEWKEAHGNISTRI